MLKTIYGKPAQDYLEQYFPNLTFVKSTRFHKLNPNVVLSDFNTSGLTSDDKYLLTKQILERERPERLLVFCHDSGTADSLSKFLAREGIPAAAFHAKHSDAERAGSIFDFHSGKVVALVCTDLACRGIDFKNVSMVLQFDYAENGIALLHRIGRTGRLGTSGKG